jgi:corrinoid protein of di/trimethylamine methyltransferase
MTKEELHQELSDAVVDMDEESAVRLSSVAVQQKFDAFETIDQGLAKGMERAGQLFEDEEYFVPELLMCADALNAGVDILKPHIVHNEQDEKIKIVIGVISGDTHDIGKNLVKLMLSSSGFDLIDLGRDVPPDVFVDRAVEEDARIIMISSLMTTTMEGMSDVLGILDERGLRSRIKVVIGGGPVSQGFADKIGADGYSPNANHAVRLAASLASAAR